MNIILLTRTSRPSGALVAQRLIENNKNLVAIVAEERVELLRKNANGYSLLLDSLRRHGFEFTKDKLFELLNIKLHFILRKLLTRKVFRSKRYLSIEELALDCRIPYFVVKDHNGKECEEIIRNLSPDLMVITNTRRLKKNIFTIPKLGSLNLHGSLVPQYAGLASFFWALYYGEKETGVTVHFVSEELDRGDILLQRKFSIWPNDTEKTLYQKGLEEGARLMVEAVTQLEEGNTRPIKQDMRLASKFGWPTKKERQRLSQMLKERLKEKGRPIKVLHVITRMIKGGAQENTLLTVLGLRNKGYLVMLASGESKGPEGEIESVARKQNIEIVIIPELVRQISPLNDLISLVKLFKLMRRYCFDVVHTHTSKAGVIGRITAKLSGVPVIIHSPHGHIFHSYFGEFKTRFFRLLEIVCANFCDKIITLTDRCKDEHIGLRIGRPEKFVTIPSGIEVKRFTNLSISSVEVKRQIGIPENVKIVGTVSRLEPVKGVEFFVEAIPLILKEEPQTHFLVVGDGSQRARLESQIEQLNLKNRVAFTGLRNDIPQLLSIMDVFVLASLNEGMGRVLIEAGLMSKPAVATRVSGIPELVEDGKSGILVPPANPEALAKGIISLLSNPEKAKTMGEQAKERMLSGFSADSMVDKIKNLYHEILTSKKGQVHQL